MNIKLQKTIIAGMALGLFATAGQSLATLLVEETFNYAASTAVNGLNGGTGWGGAWSNTDNPWSVTTPGLAVESVGIASPDNGITAMAKSSNRTVSRNFSSDYTSGVVYLGVLLCNNGGVDHYGYLSVVNGINYGFKIGWSSNTWTLAAGAAASGTWGSAVNSNVPVVLGVPVLAVLKININTKTGYLYINQATEGTPNCSATGGRFGMLTISSRAGTVSGTSSVDDIRVGTTYADVAAIPIPKRTLITVR